MDKEIGILDLDSICFAIFNPNKVLDEFGIPLRQDDKFVYQEKNEQEIIDSAEFIMNNILLESKCTHYLGYIKGKGNFRYSIKNDYKANRPKESPKWWSFVKQYLIDNWKAIEVNDYEVDDAVYTVSTMFPENSFIIAIDQDLLSLPGTHYNWKKKEWITVNANESTLKFWKDMIIGQSSDGISGLKGKGKVYAENLVSGTPYNLLPKVIFDEYLKNLGEYSGINEFYKNYSCLKLISVPNLYIPEPFKFNFKVSNYDKVT